MRTRTWTHFAIGALLGIGILYPAARQLTAQDPAPPRGVPGERSEGSAVTSRVDRFLRNDHGDVDGMTLANGRQIHFPPHIGREVVEMLRQGDEVSVQGRTETLPRGEVVFEASRIESRGRTIENRPPAPHRERRSSRDAEPAMNARGRVVELTVNRHGDSDGLLLDSGVEVKFPPHQGRQLRELVGRGDEVQVEGRRHQTPHGDFHLHADRITAIDSGRAIERDDPEAARDRELRPEQDRRGDRDDRGSASAATNDDILRELRAIRKMVEDLRR
ncbi:MAG TPA: hypothetical protein VG713_19500 [Pirellulales bacterium]|nr:hypothetical protein [Pirellulales bacterium]